MRMNAFKLHDNLQDSTILVNIERPLKKLVHRTFFSNIIIKFNTVSNIGRFWDVSAISYFFVVPDPTISANIGFDNADMAILILKPLADT